MEFTSFIFRLCSSIVTAISITENHTPPPVTAFMILRKFSPSVENCEIIAVCKPSSDISAATKLRTFAADKIGLPSFRNVTRFTIARMIV